METLGDKIIQIRLSNEMSQESLSELLGVSRQTVSQWETNASQPKIDKISAMCELFNVNADYFLKNNTSLSQGTNNEAAMTAERETDISDNERRKGKLSLKTKFLISFAIVFAVFITAVAALLICLYTYPQEGDDTVVSVSFGLTNGGIIAIISVMAIILLIINFFVVLTLIKRKKSKLSSELDKDVK